MDKKFIHTINEKLKSKPKINQPTATEMLENCSFTVSSGDIIPPPHNYRNVFKRMKPEWINRCAQLTLKVGIRNFFKNLKIKQKMAKNKNKTKESILTDSVCNGGVKRE